MSQFRRTLAVGDIHGAHKALLQVLERSKFDPAQDRLISLGDLTDYNPESDKVVSALMKIPHLVALRGNHDIWAQEFLETGDADDRWIRNGGDASIDAFERLGDGQLERFKHFFQRQLDFFVDEENRLFVHAGIEVGVPILEQTEDYLFWERALWQQAIRSHEVHGALFPNHPYKEIFIGHTPTIGHWPDMKPVNLGNIWNIDQGAKRTGKLTLIDVETKEYWQSDNVMFLYT